MTFLFRPGATPKWAPAAFAATAWAVAAVHWHTPWTAHAHSGTPCTDDNVLPD